MNPTRCLWHANLFIWNFVSFWREREKETFGNAKHLTDMTATRVYHDIDPWTGCQSQNVRISPISVSICASQSICTLFVVFQQWQEWALTPNGSDILKITILWRQTFSEWNNRANHRHIRERGPINFMAGHEINMQIFNTWSILAQKLRNASQILFFFWAKSWRGEMEEEEGRYQSISLCLSILRELPS